MLATHIYSGIAAWRFKPEAELHSFDDCEAFVQGRKGRIKLAASMTIRFQESHGKRAYIIRLYDTDILCYLENGTFWADNGGFNTITTSTRLNHFGPPHWFFSHSNCLLYGWHSASGRSGRMNPETLYEVA